LFSSRALHEQGNDAVNSRFKVAGSEGRYS
jgi:hypothetical protein